MLRAMDDDELLSIGRFGRLCGLSIGALRHYHERRCVAICEEHAIGDFDIAGAWEAVRPGAVGRR